MTLYTMQSEEAYAELVKNGVLRSNHETMFNDLSCRFLANQAYQWMANKMKEKIGLPPSPDIKYPIWTWYQIDGIKKRPDMRCSGWAEPGEIIVLMTIDVPESKVLLSDFELFHHALCNWYLAKSDEDAARFEREYKSLGYNWASLSSFFIDTPEMHRLRRKIRKSWDEIFDIHRNHSDYLGDNAMTIQGTIWELRLSQVKKVERFTAR